MKEVIKLLKVARQNVLQRGICNVGDLAHLEQIDKALELIEQMEKSNEELEQQAI